MRNFTLKISLFLIVVPISEQVSGKPCADGLVNVSGSESTVTLNAILLSTDNQCQLTN
jgi:hypothetical protein